MAFRPDCCRPCKIFAKIGHCARPPPSSDRNRCFPMWRPSAILNLKVYEWVIADFFRIALLCFSLQNFVKIWWHFTNVAIGRFQDGGIVQYHLGFSKFWTFSHLTVITVRFCISLYNFQVDWFSSFRASLTDRQTDGQTDEWMDGWTSPSLKPPFYSVGRELSNW